MALTYSKMLDLGTELPKFELPNVMDDILYSTLNLKNKNTVVMIICNHCPYVIHYHDEIKKIINDYIKNNIRFIAISSNDINNYPDDSPDKMKKLFEDLDISIPYLYDETQNVAKKYGAVCTPDFFGYNRNLELQYRGRFRELKDLKQTTIGESELINAMRMIAKTEKGPTDQIPSMGCNIKWFK